MAMPPEGNRHTRRQHRDELVRLRAHITVHEDRAAALTAELEAIPHEERDSPRYVALRAEKNRLRAATVELRLSLTQLQKQRPSPTFSDQVVAVLTTVRELTTILCTSTIHDYPCRADSEGNTALHRAAAHDRGDEVSFILARGGHVHDLNHAGQSPLHLAAHHGHADIVHILIEAGAPVTVRDRAGDLPLDLAVAGQYADCIALLSRGAVACFPSPATPNEAASIPLAGTPPPPAPCDRPDPFTPDTYRDG